MGSWVIVFNKTIHFAHSCIRLLTGYKQLHLSLNLNVFRLEKSPGKIVWSHGNLEQVLNFWISTGIGALFWSITITQTYLQITGRIEGRQKQASWHYWAATVLAVISSQLGRTIMERYVARHRHKMVGLWEIYYVTPKQWAR